MMKLAILGAGNVALATACFLSQAGHDVHLWSAFEEERAALGSGIIAAEGLIAGELPVTVAGSIGACIADAAAVVIAAPAFAHAALMSAAAPFLTAGQFVVIHPVTGLSSLLLSKMMVARGVTPTLIDTSTSLFTARKTGPARVNILKIKDVIDLAAIPADRGAAAMAFMTGLFGARFRLEPNALAVSLNNHNPVYHVPPLLCNLSRAELREDWVIWDCITPGVAAFVKLADEERLAVVRHYGTTEISVDDYFRQAHGASGEDLAAIFRSVAQRLKGPIGPQDLNHRFIIEDVPYALVFFFSLGRAAGIDMPITESLIRITSAVWRRDFLAEGHTVEALGLGGMDSTAILETSMTGFRPVASPRTVDVRR